MSDDAERRDAPDPDAWATACEEDLNAEKARRRARYGPPPTSAAEELRRLADAVTEKVTEIGKPFVGAAGSAAAQGVARQLFAQAKSTLEPVVERNPEFFDHLTAAGGELLAAYRSVVEESERRWSTPRDANAADPAAGAERVDRIDVEEAADLSNAADLDARVVDEQRVPLDKDGAPGDDGREGEGEVTGDRPEESHGRDGERGRDEADGTQPGGSGRPGDDG
ncbi:hypothetical protein DTL70_16880 [Streptomyces diacarni]|uniref:DUF5304 domain-containing protein n=1 Tax=Streptomyces diacarni TaxID=2800381 RepID=A0A367EVG6_9ACTN|nr:DUF5304 domain-containing protein [Streptomyces diacarni]RCG22126.1 hypothetical protein DTL70_16880 [Streptomyces diacarni]